MNTTVAQAIAHITALLTDADVDSPRLSAQLLAGHVLSLDRLHVELACDRELAPGEHARLMELASRRAQGELMAHLLGHREFYGREFAVGPHTLIPRPDTETLVDTVLRLFPDTTAPLTFADLGTGSGCIGITLACERPCWQGVLLELDRDALAVAQRNAHAHGVTERVRCVAGDMFAPPFGDGRLDLVVANPPYIAGAERDEVMPEVLRFEPHTALFSANDGLAHLQACASQAARLLKPSGAVVLEHGYRQGSAVRTLLAQHGFVAVSTACDLGGRERCSYGRH